MHLLVNLTQQRTGTIYIPSRDRSHLPLLPLGNREEEPGKRRKRWLDSNNCSHAIKKGSSASKQTPQTVTLQGEQPMQSDAQLGLFHPRPDGKRAATERKAFSPPRAPAAPAALQPSSPSQVTTLQKYYGKYILKASRWSHGCFPGVSPASPPTRRRLEPEWPWSAGQLQEQRQQSGSAGSRRLCPCHRDEVPQNHRVIKAGKDLQITKSNRHPNPTMPTKPRPEAPHLHIF